MVLPSAATYIRLLQLFCFPTTESSSGGSYYAPLKCRLFSASLERPPPFVALSYTWGNNKKERQLHVSAGEHAQGRDPDPSSATSFGHLVITPALNEALRHIRKAQQFASVTLWVDQICIDQRNTLEKNAQVAVMGTIYGRATQVLVWLGSSTPGSDDFIDRMATVGFLAREQDVERYFDPAKRTDEEFWQFMSKVVADSGTNADTGEQYVSDDDKFESSRHFFVAPRMHSSATADRRRRCQPSCAHGWGTMYGINTALRLGQRRRLDMGLPYQW